MEHGIMKPIHRSNGLPKAERRNHATRREMNNDTTSPSSTSHPSQESKTNASDNDAAGNKSATTKAEIEAVESQIGRRSGVINPESSMDRTTPGASTEKKNDENASKKSVAFDLSSQGQSNNGGGIQNGLQPNADYDVYVPNILANASLEEEEATESFVAKSIRLIVRRAYRNSMTGQLYAFPEGRRLIVVRNDVSVAALKDECAKTLKQTDVRELLLGEDGRVKATVQPKFLCNLDEIVAVTDPPEQQQSAFLCCTGLMTMLNLSYPDHRPLIESSPNRANLTLCRRSASRIAVIIHQLNATASVTEKGSQEVRKMSQGWARVSGHVLNDSRPFYVYPWRLAFLVDLQILIRMVGCPLSIGLVLASLPFKEEIEQSSRMDHNLYAFAAMGILGFQTALFVNAWIGYYFYVHMSIVSYLICAMIAPFLAIGLYFVVSSIYFPFYNSPVCVMLLLTSFVYLLAYPHMPQRLKQKREVKKDLGNSLLILDFFVLVFVVNRLLVLNFGQRDPTSLLVLSVMYPLLVSRSKTDCARLAEAFNRKSVAVVEAFFTFVSSVFQMIVFLSIDSKVNPLLVFALINCTDVVSLVVAGPLGSFFEQSNAQILKEHREKVDTDPFNEALKVFVKWVKDPLLMKPLLIKCYCEVSAKITFITLAMVIRWGPSGRAYPFIHKVEPKGFIEAMYFTLIELLLWICVQYMVDIYLRTQRCQYMLQKEKKNMLCIANILGLTNAFITTLLLLQQTPASGA